MDSRGKPSWFEGLISTAMMMFVYDARSKITESFLYPNSEGYRFDSLVCLTRYSLQCRAVSTLRADRIDSLVLRYEMRMRMTKVWMDSDDERRQ